MVPPCHPLLRAPKTTRCSSNLNRGKLEQGGIILRSAYSRRDVLAPEKVLPALQKLFPVDVATGIPVFKHLQRPL
jgi:hypothetical protein